LHHFKYTNALLSLCSDSGLLTVLFLQGKANRVQSYPCHWHTVARGSRVCAKQQLCWDEQSSDRSLQCASGGV